MPDSESGWDPASADAAGDPLEVVDRMREGCPVAPMGVGGWAVLRHADVARILEDHDTFSNAVSSHLSVPNGMDPPEHTPFRRLIEPYFAPHRIAGFEPTCREIAADLVGGLEDERPVELMQDLALPFAGRVQCAFLGWPQETHTTLIRWANRNHDATRSQDRSAMSEVAGEFERLVRDMLEERKNSCEAADVTAELMQERVDGRPLSLMEVTSILRNWTMGEIGTIAAAVGILGHFLAQHPDIQDGLRRKPEDLPAAIDEVLRIRGPLATNRRVATRRTEVGGRTVQPGDRLTLSWVAANRDPAAFADPVAYRPDRPADRNLLYGAGIHVCPGAPLARMELRVVIEELLAHTEGLTLLDDDEAEYAVFPASGFSRVPVRVTRRAP